MSITTNIYVRNSKSIDTFWWKEESYLELSNSVDPDHMLHSAVSDLGLHLFAEACLLLYSWSIK